MRATKGAPACARIVVFLQILGVVIAGRWNKDGKWIPGNEPEHWHEGPIGDFYKKPRESIGSFLEAIISGLSPDMKHRHPYAPPLWIFIIVYVFLVILVLWCILQRLLARTRANFDESKIPKFQKKPSPEGSPRPRMSKRIPVRKASALEI